MLLITQRLQPNDFILDLEANGETWDEWLLSRCRKYFCDKQGRLIPFAAHHKELWEWVWSIRPGQRKEPFVAIWSRHGGKSTNAELAVIAVADRKVRRYGLYISATQERADDHVQNIAAQLETPEIAARSPELAQRMVGKYGSSKGWRRNRLRTQSGFTVDALGLDSASRGAKVDEDRPDFIVLDDIDREHDSLLQTEKKIRTLTRSILPSGAHDVAVLAVQNLIHEHSIFTRFTDGRADFLVDRHVSGPHKAIEDFTYETKVVEGKTQTQITSGRPTWEGLDIKRCQGIIDNIGINSFLVELQHERSKVEGTLLGLHWHDSIHIIEPFVIPESWIIDRSFDWGSARPFSVGWWAESDGSPAPNGKTYPKGTLFRIYEWYGWNGKPNEGSGIRSTEMARGIRKIESRKKWGSRVVAGPADSSIFDDIDGRCVARDMRDVDKEISPELNKANRVYWQPCDKSPGSRIEGARLIKEYLDNATVYPMDGPGLYIFSTCRQFIRTVPTLKCDPKDPEDAWTDGEDHVYDDARYRLNYMRPKLTKIDWKTRG